MTQYVAEKLDVAAVNMYIKIHILLLIKNPRNG